MKQRLGEGYALWRNRNQAMGDDISPFGEPPAKQFLGYKHTQHERGREKENKQVTLAFQSCSPGRLKAVAVVVVNGEGSCKRRGGGSPLHLGPSGSVSLSLFLISS